MTDGAKPPRDDEFELTLLGPGYGESVVMHIGGGSWVLVDSCGRADAPAALDYLAEIGVDPAEAVKLVVASHWHDDHIRGMANMASACSTAMFCCASVLCTEEFLAAVDALEHRHFASFGSGAREIHDVFSRLRSAGSSPTLASANKRVFANGSCHIWALSPADDVFLSFIRAIGGLLPNVGQAETRIPSLSPNDVAVVLWVEVGDISVLLGSDLERRGWAKILQDDARPTGTASAFKVSHHGAASGDVPEVWQRMLDAVPTAVLTPWRRGNRMLPTSRDVQRILTRTPNAYATATIDAVRPARRDRTVERTIRESGIRLRRMSAPSAVRLRRPIAAHTQWQVDLLGTACHLSEYEKVGS